MRDYSRENKPATHPKADTTGSSRALQLKASLRGKSYDEGVQALAPVQLHGGGGADAGTVHAAAQSGVAGSGGTLPHLAAIQKSFGGHDVSNVQAHVGGGAAQACDAIGASAYATGNAVAFKGQPDLHTAAHEAAHVVQQRAGVQLKGGVGQAGDGYERHADQVADAVVQGKSAEGLLETGVSRSAHAGSVQRRELNDDQADYAERLKDEQNSKTYKPSMSRGADQARVLADKAKYVALASKIVSKVKARITKAPSRMAQNDSVGGKLNDATGIVTAAYNRIAAGSYPGTRAEAARIAEYAGHTGVGNCTENACLAAVVAEETGSCATILLVQPHANHLVCVIGPSLVNKKTEYEGAYDPSTWRSFAHAAAIVDPWGGFSGPVYEGQPDFTWDNLQEAKDATRHYVRCKSWKTILQYG